MHVRATYCEKQMAVIQIALRAYFHSHHSDIQAQSAPPSLSRVSLLVSYFLGLPLFLDSVET